MILLILSVLAIILLVFIVAANFFYNIAIKPGGFAKLMKNKVSTADSPADPYYLTFDNWWNSMPVEIMKITSHDGFALQGYYIKNDNPSNRLVFLIHGYYGKASEMAVYAKVYYEMGFDIFVPDNRGHGKSEGNAIGMGWLDRNDCLQWLELLIGMYDKKIDILIHGHSMGGATASILAGEKLPINVKGIISDCAYDSVTNIFACQLKKMFKIPSFPMINITSLICKLKAGYYFGDGDVKAQVKKSKIPMLFIHGDMDSFVPPFMIHNLYNAVDPSLRDIWVVKGAKHIESFKIEPEEYALRIRDFVERTF